MGSIPGPLGSLVHDELERTGSRRKALARLGPLNHAARIDTLLKQTLREFDSEAAAFLANALQQDAFADSERPGDVTRAKELFDEGGRLAEAVTFASKRSVGSPGCSSRGSRQRS